MRRIFNSQTKTYDYGIIVYLVLLFALPKSNIYLGGVPIYFIDIISIYLIFCNTRYYKWKFSKSRKIIIPIFVGFVISQFIFIISTGEILIPFYNLIRYSIPLFASLTFFPKLYKLLIDGNEFYFKIITYSCVLTAIILLFSSIPFTRPFIEDIIGHKFLYPSAERMFERQEDVDSAIRGLSLIGVSNISGVLLLFGIGILSYFNFKKNSVISISVILLGVIATYSRTVFIILIIEVIFLLFFNIIKLKYRILVGSVIICMIFSSQVLLTNTEYFNFDRVQQATVGSNIDSENYKHGLDERFLSYYQPFIDLLDKPLYFILGSSVNVMKSNKEIYYFNSNDNKPDHSLFGRSFYFYGLIICMYYLSILISMINTVKIDFFNKNIRFLFVFPIIIWCFTTHGMISSPNGAAMFFLAYTLISSDLEFKKYLRIKKKAESKMFLM